MGIKLSWTGLMLAIVTPIFALPSVIGFIGAIVLVIGVVLQWIGN